MKIQLPAVNEPTIRVLVDTSAGIVNMDFCGERPQEVEVSLPDVDVAECPIGYVAVGSHGQEVGEPVLLRRPDQCVPPSKSDEAGTTMMGKPVIVGPVLPPAPEKPVASFDTMTPEGQANVVAASMPSEPAKQPVAEAPPETVKVEEKVEVKTTRKGK